MPDLQFCVCSVGGPTPCHPAPTNLVVSNITSSGARFAFTPTNDSSDIYDLTLTPTTGSPIVLPNISNPYIATQLVANMGYTPSLATRCQTGSANRLIGSAFTTLAGALGTATPTAGTVTGTGFPLSWAAIANANRYVLQISANADFSSPIVNITQTGTTYSFTTGSASTQYYYRVKAQDTTGVFTDGQYGTSTATTTNGQTVHYGIGTPPTTLGGINAGTVPTFTHNADIVIPWPANNTPAQYWMAQPSTEPAKTISFDGTFPEPIGSGQTFEASTVAGYTMYSTTNPTLIPNPTTFKIS